MSTEPNAPAIDRRVVCAAMQAESGEIICSPRHWDHLAHVQAAAYPFGFWKQAKQGFVDQRGEFMDRKEAYQVAWGANQVVRRVGGDTDCLYSENLY